MKRVISLSLCVLMLAGFIASSGGSAGNELTATITITVKQGLWNNIIAFLRKLFRMNKVTI